MRPSEKWKVVDNARREYETEQIYNWEPADITEAWIKDRAFRGELRQEYIARILRKTALEAQRNDPPSLTDTHPLIQAVAHLSEEARTVVWRLGSDIEYDQKRGPCDSGVDIDKI